MMKLGSTITTTSRNLLDKHWLLIYWLKKSHTILKSLISFNWFFDRLDYVCDFFSRYDQVSIYLRRRRQQQQQK